MSAAGNKPRGFTLIELLVVVAIIAIATAGVSFALRDSQATALEKEAQRLASLLESARAQSRATGVPIRWRVTDGGFQFEGAAQGTMPDRWLAPETQVQGGRNILQLGPEPIIGKQDVVIGATNAPGRQLRISTDGLRPFKVAPAEAGS